MHRMASDKVITEEHVTDKVNLVKVPMEWDVTGKTDKADLLEVVTEMVVVVIDKVLMEKAAMDKVVTDKAETARDVIVMVHVSINN